MKITLHGDLACVNDEDAMEIGGNSNLGNGESFRLSLLLDEMHFQPWFRLASLDLNFFSGIHWPVRNSRYGLE
jgi:hypothetical protein